MNGSGWDTRVPEGMGRLEQDIYFTSADFVGAGAELDAAGGANPKRSLNIAADSDAHILIVGAAFVCTTIAQTAHLALPFILINLKMGSSARELAESDQHLLNIAGTAGLPCKWPRAKLIAANSKMKVTATNLEATARALRLTFYCFKIFLDAQAPAK